MSKPQPFSIILNITETQQLSSLLYLRFKLGHCSGKNQAIDFGSTNLVLSSQKWAKIMAIAPLMLAMNFEQPPSLAAALIAIYREERELCGRVGLTSVSQDELQCPQ